MRREDEEVEEAMVGLVSTWAEKLTKTLRAYNAALDAGEKNTERFYDKLGSLENEGRYILSQISQQPSGAGGQPRRSQSRYFCRA